MGVAEAAPAMISPTGTGRKRKIEGEDGKGKTIEPHKKKEEKLGKSIAGKEWCEKKENNLS